MKTSELIFELPEEYIAQHPVSPAHDARLMVVDPLLKEISHSTFLHITDYFVPSDVLVFNDSKVFPARLVATKPTGGKIEIVLLSQMSHNPNDHWEALVRNGSENISKELTFSPNLKGCIERKLFDTYVIHFSLSGSELMQEILKIGSIPTPPYITQMVKEEEYQNVFANDKHLGSVAAPTAGLHFTNELLEKIKGKGIEVVFLTLHVGLGTFLTVKAKDLDDHTMHAEHYEVDAETISKIRKAKREGRRVVAVGTTVCRTLETLADLISSEAPVESHVVGSTDIFIQPGYRCMIVDALVTNFHTPYSTLLALVMAFGGKDFIRHAYEVAKQERYRFYSLGDGMLLTQQEKKKCI